VNYLKLAVEVLVKMKPITGIHLFDTWALASAILWVYVALLWSVSYITYCLLSPSICELQYVMHACVDKCIKLCLLIIDTFKHLMGRYLLFISYVGTGFRYYSHFLHF